MDTCKFLVSGDVKGKFKLLFSKVEKSIKKCGPFAFLLCTGSFFGEETNNLEWEYYNSKPDRIPIQVYILGPNSDDETTFYSSIEKTYNLNEKITFVGKNGLFTMCEGIKVAYTSGLETSNENKEFSITNTEVNAIFSKEVIVDILFATQWPSGIINEEIIDYIPKCPSPLLAKFISVLKPRYFFSGFENKFYERIPLCHRSKDGQIELLTRFVGLAHVGNASEKWLYAVNMDLKRKLSSSDINNLNSYLKVQPLELLKNTQLPLSNANFHTKKKRILKSFEDKGDCWFCLSNFEQQNHLIISVGSKVYLSLSKGGLVKDHLCLVPINHISSISQVDEDSDAELRSFKTLIKQYFSIQNKKVIFYERFYKTLHAQVNCVPLDETLCKNVKSSFINRATEIGLKFDSILHQDIIAYSNSTKTGYFHVELPDGEGLFCELSSQSNFPLNFGREALVNREVLNQPEKKLWKNCIMKFEEEKLIVNQLQRNLQIK